MRGQVRRHTREITWSDHLIRYEWRVAERTRAAVIGSISATEWSLRAGIFNRLGRYRNESQPSRGWINIGLDVYTNASLRLCESLPCPDGPTR
jgi:hypothetical protein